MKYMKDKENMYGVVIYYIIHFEMIAAVSL